MSVSRNKNGSLLSGFMLCLGERSHFKSDWSLPGVQLAQIKILKWGRRGVRGWCWADLPSDMSPASSQTVWLSQLLWNISGWQDKKQPPPKTGGRGCKHAFTCPSPRPQHLLHIKLPMSSDFVSYGQVTVEAMLPARHACCTFVGRLMQICVKDCYQNVDFLDSTLFCVFPLVFASFSILSCPFVPPSTCLPVFRLLWFLLGLLVC